MKKPAIFTIAFLLYFNFVHSQGCVIVRNISGFGQYNLTDNGFSDKPWLLNTTTRFFKSFRTVRGTEDLNTPVQNENVNHVYSLDLSLTRLFVKGWSMTLSVPFSSNARTSSGEHGGDNTPRYTTHTFGLGDIRFTVYKWLLKPSVYQRGNIQLGLGIKLPTGDYRYQDYFIRNDSTKVLAPVNPSIQLGDGGTGIISELNTYYLINRTFNVYADVYYLVNPRETNGVSTTLGRAPSPLQIQTGAVETSVADQYSLRAGTFVNFYKWIFSAGLRLEGVPVRDLFGGNSGARRPGYNTSVEPGILYRFKSATVYGYLPIIIGHNIKQNVPDKKASKITGTYTQSAGGAGDFLVFLGVQFRL